MHLWSKQQLKGLQRLLSAGRLISATLPCCSSLQQPLVQQLHPPAVSHISSSAVPTKQQPFRDLLQHPSDVSRFHTARYVAVRSSAASGETDSIAAVKRLVSASLAASLEAAAHDSAAGCIQHIVRMRSSRVMTTYHKPYTLHVYEYVGIACKAVPSWAGSACGGGLSCAGLDDTHRCVCHAV